MTLVLRGKISWFGGPDDTGVASDEGLAFIYDVSDAPHLFLPYQPEGTTGLARRLDPAEYFIATRWDYDEYPREFLLTHTALVIAPDTGIAIGHVYPADWGPGEQTGREMDVSKALLEALEIETDCEAIVVFPFGPRRDVPIA
jgi:hypothetical protein